jgi:hypothetical protein
MPLIYEHSPLAPGRVRHVRDRPRILCPGCRSDRVSWYVAETFTYLRCQNCLLIFGRENRTLYLRLSDHLESLRLSHANPDVGDQDGP